jgi:hypothetical protein
MNVVVAALAVSLGVAGAAAAQEPGGVVVEMAADAGTGSGAPVSALQQARDFVREKGWQQGWNDQGGRRFLVIIAESSIAPDKNNPNSGEVRAEAFDKAMMQAKKAMSVELSAEVSRVVGSLYAEGTAAATLAGQLPPSLSRSAASGAVEQAVEVANSQAGDGGATAARELVSADSFMKATEVISQAEVAGLQAFRVFEQIGESGRGQIAVVCTFSERGNTIRRALLGLGDAPTGAPGIRIGEWAAELGNEKLLYSFGVQPRMNEKGELVLVAFGQSSPISSSPRALSAARSKARLQGMDALREFMGEMVATQEGLVRSSTLKEFSDKAEEYESEQGYSELIQSVAGPLKMPGIAAAYEWEHRHPYSDRDTAGVVLVWSVSQAVAANGLRERLAADGASRGGAGISNRMPAGQQAGQPPRQPQRPRGASGGAGAAGDEP